MPTRCCFPIDWPEPFGLVMIEALACGTPVIAWRNGSVPEVIEDGVTGFVVDSVEEAVRAVGRVAGLSRRDLPRGVRGALRRRAHGPGLPGGLPAAGACRLGVGAACASCPEPLSLRRTQLGSASLPSHVPCWDVPGVDRTSKQRHGCMRPVRLNRMVP